MKKNMKFLLIVAIIFLTIPIQKVLAEGSTKMDAWPEMKAFHEILSKAYHPIEKNDFIPVRDLSAKLLESANNWAASTPPKELNNVGEDLKNKLQELAEGAASLNKLIISDASNDEIKSSITLLHNRFHDIVGVCIKEEPKPAKKSNQTKSTKSK